MSVQDDIISARDDLIESGEPVILRSPNYGQVQTDPATGETIASSGDIELTVYGYLGGYAVGEFDGSNVLATDGKLLLPATTPRIEQGWTAFVDNKTMRVMAVNPVRNQGQDIILKCQVRL